MREGAAEYRDDGMHEVRISVRKLLFCKKSGDCGENKFSPLKTAKAVRWLVLTALSLYENKFNLGQFQISVKRFVITRSLRANCALILLVSLLDLIKKN